LGEIGEERNGGRVDGLKYLRWMTVSATYRDQLMAYSAKYFCYKESATFSE